MQFFATIIWDDEKGKEGLIEQCQTLATSTIILSQPCIINGPRSTGSKDYCHKATNG